VTAIYLAESSAQPFRVGRWVRQMEGLDRGLIHWIFLGENYLEMGQWQRVLGPEFKRVDYSKELQEIGRLWRRPYLDWITALARRYNSLEWWSSRLSERNPGPCPLFQNICYLHIAEALANRADGPLLILADSRALLRTLARQSNLEGRISCFCGLSPAKDWLRWGWRMIVVWLAYLMRGTLELWDARKARKYRQEIPARSDRFRVLMHACIDESYFNDSSPQDRYLTELSGEFRRRGYEVITIPWLENLRRSSLDAFEWFHRSSAEYLIPADYYSLGDYIWAGRILMKQVLFTSDLQRFQGCDVELLLAEAGRKGATDFSVARFVRYVRLVEKLKNRGFRFEVFVDKFENMVTEKPQVLALRSLMPDVLTVGFQHYLAPYEFNLQMFSTPEESQFAPHPDVIVCNSQFCVDLLGREGFPVSKLRLGPSLRYLYLCGLKELPVADKTVLVILPLHLGFAAEMLSKLFAAFPEGEIKFLLKLHPMMSRRLWLRALAGRSLPPHMSEVGGEIARLLPEVTCGVVGPASTVSVELLLAGIPIVPLGTDNCLDMNNTTWFEDPVPTVRSVSGLRDAVGNLCESPEASRRDAWRWATNNREQCLSPLNDLTVGVFLDSVPPSGSVDPK